MTRTLRALLDPFTLLALLILILLVAMATGYMASPPPAGKTRTITVTVTTPEKPTVLECKAGPLTLHAIVHTEPDGVYIMGSIQPPNPCYNITSLHTAAQYTANNTLTVTVNTTYREPPPGTMCIQLLPPPTPFTLKLPPPSHHNVKLVTLHFTATSKPSGETYECHETTTITLRPA